MVRKVGLVSMTIFLVLALVAAIYGQAPKSPAPKGVPAVEKPAPLPLLSNYPPPAVDFLSQYPDDPVEKVVQANAARLYRLALVQLTERVTGLERRVADLEKKLAEATAPVSEKVDPNPPAVVIPVGSKPQEAPKVP